MHSRWGTGLPRWWAVEGHRAVSGSSKKPPCPRAGVLGAGATAEHGDQAGGLTSVVAAACLDSSLRWLSILSTFANSSALMYSVSVWTNRGWDGVGGGWVHGVNVTLGLPRGSWVMHSEGGWRGLQLSSGTSQNGETAAGDRSPGWGQEDGHWALQGDKTAAKSRHWTQPHPKSGGQWGSHGPLSPGLRGLGHAAGHIDAGSPLPPPSQPWPGADGEHSPAPGAEPTLTGVQGKMALVGGWGSSRQGQGLSVAQQVLDGAQLETGVRQQHRRRTLGPAKGHSQTSASPPPSHRPQSWLGMTGGRDTRAPAPAPLCAWHHMPCGPPGCRAQQGV